MKILLDTHFLLWIFIAPEKIPQRIFDILSDSENDVYFSPVSLWEIAIKYSIGKLNLKGITPEEFYEAVKSSFLQCAELRNSDLISSYNLKSEHKDPFDRILIWQAINSQMNFLSVDSKMTMYEKYGLKVIK